MNTQIFSKTSDDPCLDTYGRVARFYDVLDAPYEYLWKRRLRARIFSHASDRILDAGVGTGCNVPFYPAASNVIGLDLSGAMLERARRAAVRLDRDVVLMERDVTDTKLPSESFDSIVATFLVCCLPTERQVAALQEMRRLLAPGGAIYLLDYTMPPGRTLRTFMRVMSPWLKVMFSARYDNHPEKWFGAAGLALAARERHMGGAVLLDVLRPL